MVVFEPGGAPRDDRANRSSDVPKMTAGRAALVGLLDLYLRAMLDPFVSLLEAHKLMYFMQVAGEPLRLRMVKGPFGPYAENLRHVLHAIEGHMVSGYADGGDRPDKRLRLVPGALEDANGFLERESDTKARLARVADLVDGFESPFGLELLSSVHWVVNEEGAQVMEEIVDRTYAWNVRKKRFTRRQIELAAGLLAEKRWLKDANPLDRGEGTGAVGVD